LAGSAEFPSPLGTGRRATPPWQRHVPGELAPPGHPRREPRADPSAGRPPRLAHRWPWPAPRWPPCRG